MWYPIKRNEPAITLVFMIVFVVLEAIDWMIGEQDPVWALVAVVMLFLLGLAIFRSVVKGIRTDEQGIFLERRYTLKHLLYPWDQVIVTYRKKEGRAAEGLMFELQGTEEGEERPYFVPLRSMKESEQLLSELREKLGERFHEEEVR